LTAAHRAIAFALGGEAGSRLASELAMATSADTLLRRIQQTQTPPVETPRVLGVDDWALRKGYSYGTILLDLERRQVVDLLPGRDHAPLQQWLNDHPGVEVISRDRASAYSQAASEAAPLAIQVADRWHLLKNVREMLERFFERHRDKLQAASALWMSPTPALQNVPAESKQQEARPEEPTAVALFETTEQPAEALSVKEQSQQDKRQQRLERYAQVRQRHTQGESIRQIAQALSLSRHTVRGYLRQDHCPDWRPGQARRTQLDGFQGWIDEQIQAGQDNAAELHRALTAKGYKGSSASTRRFVTKRLAVLGKIRTRSNAAQPRSPPVPSARSLTFDVLRKKEKRKAEDQDRVTILRGINDEFHDVLTLVEEFIALIRKERTEPLTEWLKRAEGSVSREVRAFAEGIRQDEKAVMAATTKDWSNGPVEGAVNRLKTIKRQMYGRASFALLRRRVLQSS